MSECMTQDDAMNMNNEQAIQILKPLRNMMIDQHGCPISSAVFALDKAIKALSAQQWIPCSERMPKKDGYYLTTTCYKQVYADYWNEDHFDRTEAVIAWMPLPEPYEDFSQYMNKPEEE